MKTAVIFADGVKQIVFTPENKDERFALSLITPEDDIELLIKEGSVYDFPTMKNKPFTASVSMCQGNYLRIYDDDKSKILVLKPREESEKELTTPNQFFEGEQIKTCPHGIYEVFWNTGDSSLTAVGSLHDGTRWIAPVNWTAKKYPTGNINKHFDNIKRMVLLLKNE